MTEGPRAAWLNFNRMAIRPKSKARQLTSFCWVSKSRRKAEEETLVRTIASGVGVGDGGRDEGQRERERRSEMRTLSAGSGRRTVEELGTLVLGGCDQPRIPRMPRSKGALELLEALDVADLMGCVCGEEKTEY